VSGVVAPRAAFHQLRHDAPMRRPWCTLVCIADESATDLRETAASVDACGHDARLEVVDSVEAAAAAIADADGWIGFLDAGDTVVPGAMEQIAARVDGASSVDLLYSDEIVRDDAGRERARYKPAWSPDRLRCQPYTGRLTLARAALVASAGGLRPDLGGCAEFDLVLRVGERAREVAHIPRPLCVHLAGPTPYPRFATDDVARAIQVVDEHLARTGVEAVARPHRTAPGLLRLEPRLRSQPLVSIVIPTGGARRSVRGTEVTLVVGCVASILRRSTYSRIEIVCVLDDGVDASTREELARLAPGPVRFVDFDEPFHFSRKANRGVVAAAGDVVVVLNDDTEVRTPGWIEAMLMYALDSPVGAVGARLHFEDGSIQHAGVVGVGGNPGHAYHGFPAETVGHGANALVPGNFLAVTGACLMTRKAVFLEVGGMSGWFPESYNDLDFCMKVHRAGYRVVATPDAVLDHFESSSRDGHVAAHELDLIRRRWGRLLRADPFYNPNFRSGVADFDRALSSP